jgi:catechol 2,3-dioxygenase-like lactoylglutathione lyase family enzyme
MLRISLVTLGVADVPAATRFYEALGLVKSHISGESVAFFQMGPMVLALFGREASQEDGNTGSVWTGNGGITLAQNVGSNAEVDGIMARAAAAGATILKEPQQAFWGGYHAFFADPDGHVWEIAHNPGFTLDADGAVLLP